MPQLRNIIFLSLLVFPTSAFSACTLPYNIQNGDPADASKVMANYNALLGCVNSLSPAGTAYSIQYNAGDGTFGGTSPLADGQILIGVTGGPPQTATITAGVGIQVTNGPGAITISTDGAVIPNGGLYYQVLSDTPTIASTGLSTWLNQGAATLSESDVGLSIRSPGSSSTNSSALTVQAPTPPYKVSALIAATRNSTSYSTVGLGWYDGTSKLHTFGYAVNNGGPSRLTVSRSNSPTSWNSDDFASANNGYAQPIWMQIADNGTSISFAFSQDGVNYLTLYSVAKSQAWLGQNNYNTIVFTVNPEGGETVGTLMSWRVE